MFMGRGGWSKVSPGACYKVRDIGRMQITSSHMSHRRVWILFEYDGKHQRNLSEEVTGPVFHF